MNYFPNVTQFNITCDSDTSPRAISTLLNRIISLEKLTELVFTDFIDFPFEELTQLLYHTVNLHTLKYELLCLKEANLESIQRSDIFQRASKKNQILGTQSNFDLQRNRNICETIPSITMLENENI
ncbi:unnamed protein product [Adineta ricciae]|uniref:Uncharacterized protein n=1 Tax=Adineta ricciae TaxID=249248 RepID=A0A814Q3E6_ADIRI|nr:unnamed protein product [Adineta ricciae]CAF1605476.1 unnamed protein product [Adineta ricciae]